MLSSVDSSLALGLAEQLRALSDDDLGALLREREVREAGIRNFFDLADALLEPESVQSALQRLDRPALVSVAALGLTDGIAVEDAPAAIASRGGDSAVVPSRLSLAESLGLIVRDNGRYRVPATVRAALEAWPRLGLPSFRALVADAAPDAAGAASVSPPAPEKPGGRASTAPSAAAAAAAAAAQSVPPADIAAAEQAFIATTAVVQLVAELQREPARQLARGGVAIPDTKRLAASMGVDARSVAPLLDLARRAGLVALEPRGWMATAAMDEWVLDSSAERWGHLARTWLSSTPPDVADILRRYPHDPWGPALERYIGWLYPAGHERMAERLRPATAEAQLLGVVSTTGSVLSPSGPGAVLLTDGDAAAAMGALFPTEVTQVYLQNDLTVVAPGPLVAALDARLRTIADLEGQAQASTYRVSAASLFRGMAEGETAETIGAFFEQIALTGIPQPLAYLVAEASSRHGLVRVGALPGRGTYVRSTDATLLRTLLVDQGLGALGLVRGPAAADSSATLTTLITRLPVDVVFFTLAQARYPVSAEDARGKIISAPKRQAEPAPVGSIPDAADRLIEKLRLAGPDTPHATGAAWLARQLDVAIRGKLPLTVTVQMPDGSAVDYQLEPSSVAGGRLRALDRHSDIERTLPLKSITGVGPALTR